MLKAANSQGTHAPTYMQSSAQHGEYSQLRVSATSNSSVLPNASAIPLYIGMTHGNHIICLTISNAMAPLFTCLCQSGTVRIFTLDCHPTLSRTKVPLLVPFLPVCLKA